MSAHLTAEQLDRLRDGTLPPQEVAALGSHAAVCSACAKAIAEALAVQRMLRDVRVQVEAEEADDHLSEERLMAYADDATRDDLARQHVDACDACRGEVEELRRLKFAMRRRRTWPWIAIAAAAAIIVLLLLPLFFDRAPAPAPPSQTPPTKRVIARPPETIHGYANREWDASVARAKETRTLAAPAILAALRPRGTSLRGAEEDRDVALAPDAEVVMDVRPRFRWRAQERATYNVILQDRDRLRESGALAKPSWTPSFDLKRGREYAWQLEVIRGEERTLYPAAPAPPAKFVVLGEAALNEIRDAQRRYPADALLHAVLFAHHGLREEAADAIERLRASDPTLASALRASLDAWP